MVKQSSRINNINEAVISISIMKIVCTVCKNELPLGSMAVSYDNKLFDSYRCILNFKGANLDGTSLSSVVEKSVLKTVVEE